jgi:hypothetical protein
VKLGIACIGGEDIIHSIVSAGGVAEKSEEMHNHSSRRDPGAIHILARQAGGSPTGWKQSMELAWGGHGADGRCQAASTMT